MKQIFRLLVLGLAFNGFAQERIDLTEGTLSIHGSFAFNYHLKGFDTPQHSFGLMTDIGGGYFVVDRLEVGLSLPGVWTFIPESRGELGLKLSSTYYFDTSTMLYPYVGVQVTPGVNTKAKEFQLKAGASAGMLLSLSDSVAIDFGIRPEMSFKIYASQTWDIVVPVGFVGIKAVF